MANMSLIGHGQTHTINMEKLLPKTGAASPFTPVPGKNNLPKNQILKDIFDTLSNYSDKITILNSPLFGTNNELRTAVDSGWLKDQEYNFIGKTMTTKVLMIS